MDSFLHNKVSEGVALVERMVLKGCQPDLLTYGALHPDDALNLLTEMEKKGIRPTLFTYNTLISCLCNYGRWEDAAGLLSDMIEKKINPDVVTFNALIDAFVKEGKLLEAENYRLEEAKQMFDLWLARLSPKRCDIHTLINGFCKSKRVEDGMELFREMSQRGLVGNTVTYNTLIQGFFQAGDCESAQQVFKQMVSVVCLPVLWTYNILLDGLCKNGKLEKALVIFQDMQKSEMELIFSL
ncbi:unnamed protein product [Microthlaspi erraticum]|uniref:Pentacotripeptide-repeat region of PRORP domain-containing protein n=1 Tax=Microthlaspi erraticum TaxID=1685480 RepID=A0A6D2ICQ3_9BRAS|nr:unnamed protein product [Microthlaspi erraticum]